MHWASLLPLHSSSAAPIDAQSLAVWALQFTPRVALVEEAVLLEVEASLRLFGGADSLHARVQAGAGELGALVAWAPTGLAALALARQGLSDGLSRPLQPWLDALPLTSLSAVARHQATLARVGCRTLGQVRALPRGGIARRFDAALLMALDQAYGLRPETYAWVSLPETFHARLELMARVELAPELLLGAQRLLLLMAGWLRARRLGATAFTLRWCHDSLRARAAGPGGELTIRTAAPTQNVAHFARLLGEHLAKVELRAPAGELELLATEVQALTEESHSLIPDPAHQGAGVRQALERIQARLGEDCIRRPQLCADHRLEWMQRWSAQEPRRSAKPQPLHGLPLPTWVLAQPLQLVERENRPHYQGRLQLLLGPDRVEGGWWDRDADSTSNGEPTRNVQRDYWLALSPHAGLLWVFQARLAGEKTAWFLHGHYG